MMMMMMMFSAKDVDRDQSYFNCAQVMAHLFFKRLDHFTLVKEALIEIGCVVTSLVVGWLVVGWLVDWLVVTRVHCGQTVHPRPIVTMEH